MSSVNGHNGVPKDGVSKKQHSHSEDQYQSPFRSRYCRDSPLLKIFSETEKIITWRRLWLYLAQAQQSLGLVQVTQDMIAEMEANLTNIDWNYARSEERRLRHDVMAHIHTFELVCPKAAGVIHLGATSAYVQDNADLIAMREALDSVILPRIVTCLQRLGTFSDQFKSLPTVGRTHYQAASLTTVGKRACVWAQEVLIALEGVLHFRKGLRFRGVQGATGSQASFLTLFRGDEAKVDQLNTEVTRMAGFDKRFLVTGQTYSRLQDAQLLNALSLVGSAVQKVAMDIRILQAFGEIQEPFEDSQVGSSAMPYKRNPMRSERCCGFARYLMNLPGNTLLTAAEHGLERTLDDSANRRLVLPDAFLCCEALLRTFQNILEGLVVCEGVIRANVEKELPFLALEHVLMELTLAGQSRQESHEKIRKVSLRAHEQREKGMTVSLSSILEGDSFFDPVRDLVPQIENDPGKLTGNCSSQVDKFLKEELAQATKQLGDKILTGKSQLSV